MTHGQQAGPGATSPENTHVAGPEGSERPGRQESGRGRRSLAAAAVVGLVAGLVGGGGGAGTAWAVGGCRAGTGGWGAGSAADVEQVAKAVTPSVVLLKVQGSGVADEGSGVVLSANGMILTNNHVVEAAANGGSVLVEGSDGKTY